MSRYWISWYQPDPDNLFELSSQWLNCVSSSIVGAWISGSRVNDNSLTICAIVDTDTKEKAKCILTQQFGGIQEWRFCDKKPDTWNPGNRFP
jgi:hypothetical protein